MNNLALSGMDGRKPLGYLAAIGLTRLLAVHGGDTPRLSWKSDTSLALLTTHYESIDALVECLLDIVQSIPGNGVLPGVPAELPPPGAAPDRLRLRPELLRQWAREVAPISDPEAEAWLSSLVTDLSVDDRGRSDISLMAAPSGKQSMRTMLEKPLAEVRSNPECLREALVGWRRYPGVTGEYLDHQVLFDAGDSGAGESEERGVPGATWLALMGYPLLRTTAQGADPITSGWHRRPRRPPIFLYPLWTAPLDCDAIVALLEHPLWRRAVDGSIPDDAKALSVFTIQRSQRRRIPGRTFAGVLGPVP